MCGVVHTRALTVPSLRFRRFGSEYSTVHAASRCEVRHRDVVLVCTKLCTLASVRQRGALVNHLLASVTHGAVAGVLAGKNGSAVQGRRPLACTARGRESSPVRTYRPPLGPPTVSGRKEPTLTRQRRTLHTAGSGACGIRRPARLRPRPPLAHVVDLVKLDMQVLGLAVVQVVDDGGHGVRDAAQVLQPDGDYPILVSGGPQLLCQTLG